MVVAAADLVAEHRDGPLSAAAVITRAGVAPGEFHAAFDGLEECLLAAFDEALVRLVRSLTFAIPSDAPLITKIEGGLCGLLWFVEEEPGWGRLLLVELPVAAHSRRQRAVSRLACLVSCVGTEALLDSGPPPPQAVTCEVAEEVLGVIADEMAAAQPSPPRELSSWLMATVIEPRLPSGPGAIRGIAPVKPRHRRRISATTARSARVLRAVARLPGSSNRDVARAAGVPNDSNVSAHLRRLQRQGLIRNATRELGRGKPNAWVLTPAGEAFVAARVAGSEMAA